MYYDLDLFMFIFFRSVSFSFFGRVSVILNESGSFPQMVVAICHMLLLKEGPDIWYAARDARTRLFPSRVRAAVRSRLMEFALCDAILLSLFTDFTDLVLRKLLAQMFFFQCQRYLRSVACF